MSQGQVRLPFLHPFLALTAMLLLSPTSLSAWALTFCPTTCGITDGPQDVSFSAGAADLSYPAVSSSFTCASLCSNFQYWALNTRSPFGCYCFYSCSAFSTPASNSNLTLVGLVQACNPPSAQAAPTCPSSVYYAGNANYGFASTDPSVTYSTTAQSPEHCLKQCASISPLSYYYQFATSNASAHGFSLGDCLCLSKCKSSHLLNLAPMTFVQGSLCSAASALLPRLPPPACPLHSYDTFLSCTPSASGAETTNGVRTQGYSCTLCNPQLSPLAVADVQLTCANFDPVSLSGVTPACLVPGATAPGCCSTFSFQNPVELGTPTLQITADPFASVLVSTVPTSTGAGSELALGPCVQDNAGTDCVGAIFTYSCPLVNTGTHTIVAIILQCSNFSPLSGSGSLNPDCTLSATLEPLASTSFSFSTHSASIVMSVGSYSSF